MHRFIVIVLTFTLHTEIIFDHMIHISERLSVLFFEVNFNDKKKTYFNIKRSTELNWIYSPTPDPDILFACMGDI